MFWVLRIAKQTGPRVALKLWRIDRRWARDERYFFAPWGVS